MKKYIQQILGTDQILEETRRLSKENAEIRFQFEELTNQMGAKLDEDLPKQLTDSRLINLDGKLDRISSYLETIIPPQHSKENELLLEIPLSDQTILKKVDLNQIGQINSEATLVSHKEVSQGLINSLFPVTASYAIAKHVANGLYTTTADPNTLMKLVGGTYGTAVMKGGKISGHVGFQSVSLATMAPLIAFQAATIITGQIHMKQITEKLKSIDEKLDVLMSYHKYERIARLKYFNHKITEFYSRNFFAPEDFVIIDQIKYDLQIVKEECFLIFREKLQKCVSKYTPSKINRDTCNKGIWASIKEEAKAVTENSKKDLEQFIKSLNESEVFAYAEISLTAEKLYESLLVIELLGNLKVQDLTNDRLGKIEELKYMLQMYKEDNREKVTTKVQDLYNDFVRSFNTYADAKRDNSFRSKDKIRNIRDEFKLDISYLESLLDFNTKQVMSDLNHSFESPYEITIEITDKEEKVYMKQIKGV